MKIDICKDISFYLVKGEILKLSPNPWIRPFLKYIHEHPNLSECDISRDLFADNGHARVAAAQNILFFFKENGLLDFNKGKGYGLTEEGLHALETAKLWQGMKGVFLFTIWNSMTRSFILNIQPVPEHWYDTAKNAPEEFSDLYGNEDEYPKLCVDDIRLKYLETSWIETFQKTDFEANVFENGSVEISGTPSVKGLKEYQVKWNDKTLTRLYFNDDEENDDLRFSPRPLF